jgi:hypothetical protein
LFDVLIAACACLQVFILNGLEVVVVNYALFIERLAERAFFTLLLVQLYYLNY